MESSKGIRFAGDVDIEKVQIVTSSGFYQDVLNQILTIQIFEDMFSPFISGSLILRDSLDLVNTFPLVGEEFIDLKINTPSMKKNSIQGRFYIYKLSDREIIGDRTVVYKLSFISIEALTDLNKKVSRTFSGKISDIAYDLISSKTNGLESEKKTLIEGTNNSVKYTSNFWSPVKNLNYIAEQATNATRVPSYLFYENRDGFNFVSLDSLYGVNNFQEFVYDKYTRDDRPQGGSIRNIEEDFKRITSYSIPTTFDYFERIRSGMYASKMVSYDLTTKRYLSKNYNFFEKFESQKHLNPYPLSSLKGTFKNDAYSINVPKYYGNFNGYTDVTNSRTIQQRVSLMTQSTANKIQITVPGRVDYTVGRRVNLRLDKMQPVSSSDRDTLDRIYSGNYIISAINHYINAEAHECHMELIKDSLMLNLNGNTTK